MPSFVETQSNTIDVISPFSPVSFVAHASNLPGREENVLFSLIHDGDAAWDIDLRGNLVLRKGNVLLRAKHRMTVSVDGMECVIDRRSVVGIVAANEDVTVSNLSDTHNGAVVITDRARRVSLTTFTLFSRWHRDSAFAPHVAVRKML